MAKCRITTLTPTCDYSGSGAVELYLLDLEDFIGLVYEGAGAYDSCYVENILRQGEFVRLDLRDNPGQYTGTLAQGVYTHRLETFIPEVSGDLIASLHLAIKRPQVAVFRLANGKLFVCGQDGGLKVNYSLQTAEGAGAAVAFNNLSQFPLYEVSPQAMADSAQPFTYSPVFTGSSICQVSGGVFTGNRQAVYAVRVSMLTGEQLDLNGRPIVITGLPAAVLVLTGEPTPAGFVKAGEYAPGAMVNGQPTVIYDPLACPDGTAAPWVLDTGFWDMYAYWFNNGVWNFSEPVSRGQSLGDSTIAPGSGKTQGVNEMVLTSQQVTQGYSLQTLAGAGETIQQQRARIMSDTGTYHYIVVQVGLNNMNDEANTIVPTYQSMINDIKAARPNTKIIISCMLPCRSRWAAIGWANGQSNWEALNYAIMNTITNVDGRIDAHVPLLSDGEGNLAAAYNTGDNIHENAAGAQIIANAWRDKLEELNLI